MVDIDSPILVQEPFLDRPTPKPNRKHAIKPILIFIICFIVLSLVAALTVTILVGKKKQATSSYVSTIATTTGNITHAFPSIITNASSTTIKYPSTTSITFISPTKFESSATETTAAITSVDSTTTMMIPSITSESEPNGCQLPLIPTYNSNKVIVAGGDSPGSSVSELNKPVALALDSKSNLFVVDYNNYRVMKYSPNSKSGERVLGHGTDRYPRATYIFSLFIDVNDVLYTCQRSGNDQMGQMIYEFIIWPSSSKNGTVLFNKTAYSLFFAIDRNSNLYVFDGNYLCIYNAPAYRHLIGGGIWREFPYRIALVDSSSFYVDPNDSVYIIHRGKHQILKRLRDDMLTEIALEKTPILLAVVTDCHNNLYTINADASLIIYNSDGEVISTMHNAIDNPMDLDSFPYNMANGKEIIFPEYYASLVLDSRNGDLYVAMYGYDRVTKFSLNK